MMARWQDARRILCVRPDALGAVLMCTPAMRALHAAVPGRTLTLLGSPAGAAALPHVPELQDAIACRPPWMETGAPMSGRAGSELVETLAARAFDAAVIFTSYTQSALPAALACHLAGIPLRLAYSREHPHALLTDWLPDPEPETCVRHEVQRQLALVRGVGCRGVGSRGVGSRGVGGGIGIDGPGIGRHGIGRRGISDPAVDGHPAALGLSFDVKPADLAAVRVRLRAAGVEADAPWLLLHPGAGAASHRYPPGHWAQVLKLLARAPALPLVLTGSAAEADRVDAIRAAAGVPALSLAGRLTLGELGAALRLAAVAVSGNTAPAHIAAAVGTPVVALYALTHPQHTPWSVPNRVLFQDMSCRFCFESTCPAGHHACLAGVAPARVADAVTALLQHRVRRTGGRAHPPPHGLSAREAAVEAWPNADAT